MNLIFRNKVAIHHNSRLLTTTMISYMSKITALQTMLNPNDQKTDVYVVLTHNLVTIIHNRDTVNLVFQHQHSSICNTKSVPNEETFSCYLNSSAVSTISDMNHTNSQLYAKKLLSNLGLWWIASL